MSIKKIILLGLLIGFVSCSKNDEMNEPITSSPKALITIIQDNIEGKDVVVVGSAVSQFIVSFYNDIDGQTVDFSPLNSQLPVIMEDTEGNTWDVFGEAVSGPRKGEQLIPTNSSMGYWFAFASQYPGVDIYGEEQSLVDVAPETIPEWLFPSNYLFFATGQDLIPALSTPDMEEYLPRNYPNDDFYLEEEDLVIAIKIGDEIRIYPHGVLDWHEIINDKISDTRFALNYCPLAGTAKVWKTNPLDEEDSFGVSGYLYNSAIVPFDRATNSYWWQLEGICANGERVGERIEQLHYVETTWRTWSRIFNKVKVVSPETGYGYDYVNYPYGNYVTNDRILSPVIYTDNRLHVKERVHGIMLNGKAKTYRFSNF